MNGLRKAGEVQSFDKALAVDANFKEALKGKGDALSRQGNDSQALQYYDKALSIY